MVYEILYFNHYYLILLLLVVVRQFSLGYLKKKLKDEQTVVSKAQIY